MVELTDVTLPFILIEDLFDSQTIDSCQQLFEYLESRVERLTTVSLCSNPIAMYID